MSSFTFPEPTVDPLRGGPVLRWGVLGSGFIAHAFCATVRANTDQQVVAVGSRSSARSSAFGAQHDIEAAPGYRELVSRPDVDIVYIATPQIAHQQLALLAIAAGKHVLIEKPIAINAREARSIATAARQADVLAAEALWTSYLPQSNVIAQIIRRGDLGDIRLATADVGWQKGADADPRHLDPTQGGGAALDMGVYGYWFAQFAIGRPARVTAVGTSLPTGVDDQSVVAIEAAHGRCAAVTTTMAVANSGLAGIFGTRGSVQFIEPFVYPARFVAAVNGERHEWSDRTGLKRLDGLAWQATAIPRMIAEGYRDSPVHGLEDSIATMEVIDAVRAQIAARGTP